MHKCTIQYSPPHIKLDVGLESGQNNYLELKLDQAICWAPPQVPFLIRVFLFLPSPRLLHGSWSCYQTRNKGQKNKIIKLLGEHVGALIIARVEINLIGVLCAALKSLTSICGMKSLTLLSRNEAGCNGANYFCRYTRLESDGIERCLPGGKCLASASEQTVLSVSLEKERYHN